MSNMIGVIALIAILLAAFIWFMGFGLVLSTVALVVAIVAALKYANVSFARGFPTNRKQSMWVALIAFLLFLAPSFGWIEDFSLWPGELGPGGGAGDEGGDDLDDMSASDCWSRATEELRGKSSTPTLNAYDQQSNTPRSAAVDCNPTYVYLDGQYLASTSDTSDYASITNAVVGKVLDIYPAGTTYYGEHKSVCIDSEGQGVELAVHTIASDANMDVTCTDDTNAAALSAAGNTTQSDYGITIGAEGEESFYCKWKTNDPDEAFQFAAIAIGYEEGTSDTIDGVSVVGIDEINNDNGYDDDSAGRSFSKETIPKFIQNHGIWISGEEDATAGNATDGYEDYYELNEPILLEEWESINVQFTVEAGGTDPTADVDDDPSGKTAFYLYGIDATYTMASDGMMEMSTYTLDTSEDNVGLTELLYSPVGSTLGVAVELI